MLLRPIGDRTFAYSASLGGVLRLLGCIRLGVGAWECCQEDSFSKVVVISKYFALNAGPHFAKNFRNGEVWWISAGHFWVKSF